MLVGAYRCRSPAGGLEHCQIKTCLLPRILISGLAQAFFLRVVALLVLRVSALLTRSPGFGTAYLVPNHLLSGLEKSLRVQERRT
jgi:hypothetical protein